MMDRLASTPPFSKLAPTALSEWLQSAEYIRYSPGERLIRPDEINSSILVILKGTIRLIAIGDQNEGSFTLSKRGAGQLVGWSSLLRGGSCEFVIASTEVVALSLHAATFVSFIYEVPEFASYFLNQSNQHEAYTVAVAAAELQVKRSPDWRDGLSEQIKQARTISLKPNSSLEDLQELPKGWNWHLSTPDVPGIPLGTSLKPSTEQLPERPGFRLPYRIVALPEGFVATPSQKPSEIIKSANDIENPPIDLQQLGILEDEQLHDEERRPVVRGKGAQREALAVCEMVALNQQVPFRRDTILKFLKINSSDKGQP